MIPTISLGVGNAPELVVASSEINPIVAIVVEIYSPLAENERNSVLSFLALDTLFLDAETNIFFQMLECACKRITSGEIDKYNVDNFCATEFWAYVRPGTITGEINENVVCAAQKYLTFLSAHPKHWPLRRA